MYRQTSGYKACSIYGFHDAVNIVSTKPYFKCLIRVIAFNAPPTHPYNPKTNIILFIRVHIIVSLVFVCVYRAL